MQRYTDIYVENDYGFRLACYFGHVDLVQFLLTSPELSEHADIHVLEYWVFKTKKFPQPFSGCEIGIRRIWRVRSLKR